MSTKNNNTASISATLRTMKPGQFFDYKAPTIVSKNGKETPVAYAPGIPANTSAKSMGATVVTRTNGPGTEKLKEGYVRCWLVSAPENAGRSHETYEVKSGIKAPIGGRGRPAGVANAAKPAKGKASKTKASTTTKSTKASKSSKAKVTPAKPAAKATGKGGKLPLAKRLK